MSGKSTEPPKLEMDVELDEAVPPSRLPTAPPPFDPAEYARESESVLRSAEATLSTQRPPPPLHSVPLRAVVDEDLEWFELPMPLRQLYEEIDGQSSLGSIAARLAVADHDAMSRLARLLELGVAEIRDAR